jgi:two-component system LytT family response regulator
MPRALIIDDEPPACDILRALLSEHPQVRIVGEVGTIDDARTRLAQDDYDLVFLDIQLRGGSGFDLTPHIRPGAHIIFVTAFDQHALRAFEINALDYILKPVSPERLAVSLRRAPVSAAPGGDIPESTPSAARSPLTSDDRVLLKLGTGSERFVRLSDIRCLASCENYSELYLRDGERVFVRKTMKAWEQLLPASFVRAHRHAIVNTQHLERIERVSVSTSLLHLSGVAEPIRASYRYLAALREKVPAQG